MRTLLLILSCAEIVVLIQPTTAFLTFVVRDGRRLTRPEEPLYHVFHGDDGEQVRRRRERNDSTLEETIGETQQEFSNTGRDNGIDLVGHKNASHSYSASPPSNAKSKERNQNTGSSEIDNPRVTNTTSTSDISTSMQQGKKTSLPESKNHQRRRRSTVTENQAIMEDGLIMKPIGVVRSVYRLCVGTPRQGLIAPMSRGYIDLLTMGHSSPASSVEGLEEYSHIWVVFVFHLNTKSDHSARRFKSKISPPALGGQKVGVFATRSPHRSNPIGMTLCKLDRIEKVDKRHVRLHISGQDLVDGTPVLDIKPYVPVYDSVEQVHGVSAGGPKLPAWVKGGLSLQRTVIISDLARLDLETILRKDPHALEFYGPHAGEATREETLEAALESIRQVLAIDVRSSYQTKKSRDGRYKAERSDRLTGDAMTRDVQLEQGDAQTEEGGHCTQQLDNLLIQFSVETANAVGGSASRNSGAEDTVHVAAIELLDA